MIADYWHHLSYIWSDQIHLAILIFILVLIVTTLISVLFILIIASVLTLINIKIARDLNIKQSLANIYQTLKLLFLSSNKSIGRLANIHALLLITALLSLFIVFLLLPSSRYLLLIPSNYNSILIPGLMIVTLISVTVAILVKKNIDLLQKNFVLKSGLFQVFIFLFLILSLVPLMIKDKSLDLITIVVRQNEFISSFLPSWNIIAGPTGFLAFFIYFYLGIIFLQQSQYFISYLESDTPHAHARFFTCMEISLKGVIFLFFMIGTLFFLGGWLLPYQKWSIDSYSSLAVFSLFIKTILLYLLANGINYRLPNFSHQQILQLNLRFLFPINLLNIILTQLFIII